MSIFLAATRKQHKRQRGKPLVEPAIFALRIFRNSEED